MPKCGYCGDEFSKDRWDPGHFQSHRDARHKLSRDPSQKITEPPKMRDRKGENPFGK